VWFKIHWKNFLSNFSKTLPKTSKTIIHYLKISIFLSEPEFALNKNRPRRDQLHYILLYAWDVFGFFWNSPPRTSQEASSRNFHDFNPNRSGEALLTFAETRVYWRNCDVPSAWPWRQRANKPKIESPSNVRMCEVSTPQWSNTQVTLRRCNTSLVDQSAVLSVPRSPVQFRQKIETWELKSTFKHIEQTRKAMGWLRLVGSIKL